MLVGLISIKLDRVPNKEDLPKERQLIAVAGYENDWCTKFLVNNILLDAIYNSSNMGLNQPPEFITNGLLGTDSNFYYYLATGNKLTDSLFEFSNLEIISGEKIQNLLKNTKMSLI